MPRETHKRQSENDSLNDRRERLAQELRANLLKRKALARARRTRGGPQAQADADQPNRDSAEKADAAPEPGDELTRS